MRLIYPVAALVGVLVLSACTHTGGSHSKGQPAAGKNYALTYEQVREAAQDGDADAQYALGYMYYYGQNVTRNGKQARFWIGRAASQHHNQASRALKMMDAEPAPNMASATPGRPIGSGQNSWQEVRRPQEAFVQSEPATKPNTLTNAPVDATTKNKAKSTLKADNESKPQSKKHPRAQLRKKNGAKNWTKHRGAQAAAVATNDDADDDVNVSSPKAHNTPNVPHRAANESNVQHSATNKVKAASVQSPSVAESSAASDDVSSADQPDSDASIAPQGQKTASEKPNFQLAQDKNTHPVRKTAQNSAKSSKSLKTSQARGAKLSVADGAKSGRSSKGQGALSTDERSILATPGDHYTLQLIGTSTRAPIQQVIDRNHLRQKAKVYHTKVRGKDFYVLIYGSYPSQAAATAEITRLPASIQQLRPWAKPYAAVKASINNVSAQ